jgi:hypothetical protein
MEMDERAMIDLHAAPLFLALPVCFAGGLGLGFAYFHALRLTANLIVRGGHPVLGLALTIRSARLSVRRALSRGACGRSRPSGCAGRHSLRQDADAPPDRRRRRMNSPLESVILFQLGPLAITQAIVTTWAIMVVLVFGGFLLTRRLALAPTGRQAALELMVTNLDTQIRETTGAKPAPYRGFIGTLFLFILVANWSSLAPGLDPPTAQLETDAALALLVFLSVIWFGVRGGGLAAISNPSPRPIR